MAEPEPNLSGEETVNFSKRLRGKIFSARSQANYQRENLLRKQLQAIQEVLSRCQRVADYEQAQVDQLTKNTVSGEGWARAMIPEHLAEIQKAKAQIEVFAPQREKIRAEIEALVKPNPTEEKERAENQKAVATLALERLECDRALADLIESVRLMLEKRVEMTNRIWELAQKVDLQIDARGLDERTLTALKTAVGCDVAGQGSKWVDRLFGENRKTQPYTVLDERIVLPETLASAGVYKRGDQVDLTSEEVAEIRSTEGIRRGNIAEVLPGGAVRSGASIEVRHARIQRNQEAS